MKLASAICATAAVVLLAGCATYATPAGTAVAVATPAGTQIWYDDFYGPVYSGYWGADGMYHYQTAANGPWVVDRAGHFRRAAVTGYHTVTITAPAVIPAG